MRRSLTCASLTVLLTAVCSAVTASAQTSHTPEPRPAHPAAKASPQAGAAPTYSLVAWSELGMHCMDGKDYSVFAVLPPYNTIHAQLLERGEPPVAITTGVTITYQAVADTTGSINTTSANKSNFWNYTKPLFQANVVPEEGLAGYATQSKTPHKMSYNGAVGYWEAVGIPTMPYDDKGVWNPYSMAQIVARDASGKLLASTNIVVPVSDEMSCKNCHGSGTSAPAKPATGWVYDPDALKDAKLNILKKHDDRWNISSYLSTLKGMGWNYQSSLYKTATAGTPILCAACHGDVALSLNGIKGIKPLSQDMHALHGSQINPATGVSLDKATTDLASCYLCHPGPKTQCKRGAMNTQRCSDCHGVTTHVGDSARAPWLVEPACQSCHNTSTRYTTAFDSTGKWRTTTDLTFATNKNAPVAGSNLFRYSSGHGKVFCSACHGSPHAEFPTLQPNDNVYSIALQGHTGKLTECSICHTNLAVTATGGPHGLHTIGQSWVSAHGDYADGGAKACAYCHGATYKGSVLSRTSMARTFKVEGGARTFTAGHAVSCYDCHNGPNGG
ncbi:MAG: hypothetical protein WCE75_12205 [Terracidiphilus sp.]